MRRVAIIGLHSATANPDDPERGGIFPPGWTATTDA
jgi:hypothetical protein